MNLLGVSVGWAGGTGLNSVDAVRAEARYAAKSGFDSFWVSQIFGVDPIVALVAAAGELEEIEEVGTSVVPIYGRHPLALAAQARTAQAVFDGRFTLGLGPSHAMVVEGFLGESYARPFTHTAEYLAALGPLLRGEKTDLDGDEVTAHGWLDIEAKPVPMLLAAMGPRMLKLAAQTCAGTSLGGAVGPKTIAEHIAPTINASARDAGRSQPRIKALVTVSVTNDPHGAREYDRAKQVLYAELPAYRAMLDREGLASPADLLVAGSQDEVVAGLQRYVDAGATELRVGASGPDEATRARTREALAEVLSGS